MPKIVHSDRNLISRLHEWQSLIGTLISQVVVIIIAIWVTSSLTASMKRTEFFLTFTKRYHEIRVAAHDLDKKVKKEPSPFDEGDPNYCLTQETFEMRANWGSITGKTWATAPACALPSVRPLQGRTSRARLPAGPSSLPG